MVPAKPTVKLGSVARSSSTTEHPPHVAKIRSTDISSLDNLMSRVKGAMSASKLVAREEAKSPPKLGNEAKPPVASTSQTDSNKVASDAAQSRAKFRPGPFADRDPLPAFEATRRQRTPTPPPAWKAYPVRLPPVTIKRAPLTPAQFSRYNRPYRGNTDVISWRPTLAQMPTLFREHYLFRKKYIKGVFATPVRLPTRRIGPGYQGDPRSPPTHNSSPPLGGSLASGRGGGFGLLPFSPRARVKGRSDEGPWRRAEPVPAPDAPSVASTSEVRDDLPEAPETVLSVELSTSSAASPPKGSTTIAVSLPAPRSDRATSVAAYTPPVASNTGSAIPESSSEPSSRAKSKLPEGSNVAFYRRGTTHSEITPDSAAARVFKFGSVGDGITPAKRNVDDKPAAIGQGRARDSSSTEVCLFFLVSVS
jgi:serine/arginine repetitive matrix protein 2